MTQQPDEQAHVLTAADSMEIANFVRDKGWVPIPLEGKAPKIPGWQRVDRETGHKWCLEKSKWGMFFNVGVVCGLKSNLCIVDVDNKIPKGQEKTGVEVWTELLVKQGLTGDLKAAFPTFTVQ